MSDLEQDRIWACEGPYVGLCVGPYVAPYVGPYKDNGTQI